jgi:hypothetical protein
MVDIILGLWSNRDMRTENRSLFNKTHRISGRVVARAVSADMSLDLLALGSLLALLIIGTGAGTG